MGTLRNLAIQPRTLKRYECAVELFFEWFDREHSEAFNHGSVACPLTAEAVDSAAADYLEALWDDGSPRSRAADTLSGLQHFVPQLRRELKESWRLLRVWDQNEIPNRAPPLLPCQALLT